MTLNDISRDDAIKLVEFFDSKAFVNLVKPLLEGEQDSILRQMIGSRDPETDARLKGRIEQMTDFIAWRDIAYGIATQEASEENA